MTDAVISEQLKLQDRHLTKINNMLYGLIFLVFLTIFLTFINTYFDFRSHLCKYSNVKKCLASDKRCPHSGSVVSSHNINFETLSTQNFQINTNLSEVKNHQLSIVYPSIETNFGTCIFNMDFNFTDKVPSGGVSNLLNLGPSVGYVINNNEGCSIYLYPFKQDNLPGSSIQQIEYVISQSLFNSGNVMYLDEPFEFEKNTNTSNFGITYIKGDQNTFQLGGYVKDGNVQLLPTNSYGIASTESGKSSLFNNFNNTSNVPMQQTTSANQGVDITGQIIANNTKNKKTCTDTNPAGCTCVDPVITKVPDCKNYYYDKLNKIYRLRNGSGDSSEGPTVRFCSNFSSTNNNFGSGIQKNQPPSYNSTVDGNKAEYYYSGYNPSEKPNTGAQPTDRYTLGSIFCSDFTKLTNDKQNNKLYEPNNTNTNTSSYTNLSKAYNSSQPNGRINPDGSVNLGHF